MRKQVVVTWIFAVSLGFHFLLPFHAGTGFTILKVVKNRGFASTVAVKKSIQHSSCATHRKQRFFCCSFCDLSLEIHSE
ncbi:hypothetical protein DRJ53_20395 [Paracnuella aquatica]|nr:hypothetical protein DRJ53_20395 [Paracnuella aquatica]